MMARLVRCGKLPKAGTWTDRTQVQIPGPHWPRPTFVDHFDLTPWGDTSPFKPSEKLSDVALGKIIKRVRSADPFLVHFVHQVLKGVKVLFVPALGDRPEDSSGHQRLQIIVS